MAEAYEQIKIARRCLTALTPPVELTSHLQSAEADLVRAMVVANEMEMTAIAGQPADRLVSIAQHRSSLSHPA
jgi:hypothetical protein